MSILDGKIMKENDLTPFSKVGLVLLVILPTFASAGINIARGHVPHPAAFGLMIVGFILFIVAKLSVIRRTRWVSFGTTLMTENMANVYRLGYWLMAVGILFTFA